MVEPYNQKGKAQIMSSIERYCYPRGTNLNNNSIGLVACPFDTRKEDEFVLRTNSTVSSLISNKFPINLQIVNLSLLFYFYLFMDFCFVSYCYILFHSVSYGQSQFNS